MKDIWLISDTHFGQETILTATDSDGKLIRGHLFASVEEMDEAIIQNWNSVVKPNDIVYHLGDVFRGCPDDFITKWSRLNGTKHLILGNHDNAMFFTKNNLVESISMWKLMIEELIILSHVPSHPQSTWLYPSKEDTDTYDPIPLLNIHGHLHQNTIHDDRYRCVSVEQINYTPVNLEIFLSK